MILKQSYEEWKTCIFSENGNEFSREFIQSRIRILEDRKQTETQKFITTYGLEYTNRIIGYFKQALNEIR